MLTAIKYKIKNEPLPIHEQNLKKLSINLLDPVREFLGRKVKVNSGFRSFDLNKKIGGSTNSAHTVGCAADLLVTNEEQLAILRFLMDKDITLYQAIIYPNRVFIHLSLMPTNNRRETLISKAKGQYERIFV